MWGILAIAALTAQTGELPDNEEPEVLEVRGNARDARAPDGATRVYLDQFAFESVDLGELLARQHGITVQRTGGLGSAARISLNGLSGDQIRYFVDGVPLDLAGFQAGIENLPAELFGEVRVFRGVVPTRLGADALGGAIELRTDSEADSTGARATYRLGSFGTHRASASGSAAIGDRGFVRSFAYYDRTNNRFEMTAEVPNALGQATSQTVERFNDDYEASGASMELGLGGDETLALRAFFSSVDRGIQNDPFGVRAFGEASRSSEVMGGTGRFDLSIGRTLRLFGSLGATRTVERFLDRATCVYSWLGECAGPRGNPGELNDDENDTRQRTRSLYLRSTAEVGLTDTQSLRFSIAPTYSGLTGDEAIERPGNVLDPVEAESRLLAVVGGVEHEAKLLDEELVTLAFGKFYGRDGQTEDLSTGQVSGTQDFRDSYGGGGALGRYRLADRLFAEASYEYATRLPNTNEVFGVPGQIQSNVRLRPERSHNANLGIELEPTRTAAGMLRGELNAFLRETTDLIRPVGADPFIAFANVGAARSLGAEASAGWVSPGRTFSVDASLTYMDFRNTSSSGPNAAQNGDRIPNAPYFFGSATARLRFEELVVDQDALELAWTTRFTNEFFFTWESLGDPRFKPTVPDQFSSTANLGYRFAVGNQQIISSLEAQNLFEQTLFDFFGVQRPGRAFFARLGFTTS
ncbi:MAG: TonB-dependent receptor plug domain-containing protein [Myxococcota bacterium]